MDKILRAGTRKSPLALRQVEEILGDLKKIYPKIRIEIIGIDTTGDKDKKTPVSEEEGTDFFTREIDTALLKGKIDFALHSAKDLPDTLPSGIEIAAVTKSIDPYDVLVSKNNMTLKELPAGARIGTSSRRRKDQITAYRPDIEVVDLRGNIEERLEKLDKGNLDAIVIAGAGLIRLGLDERISEKISFDILKPHPLQGCLAITVRKNDKDMKKMFSKLNHKSSFSKSLKRGGKVYLIGAGPGDPGLITVKGLRALKEADTVLYDNLVPKDLLKEVKPGAELVPAGKTSKGCTLSQGEINRLMAKKAQEGKLIARLKGGDPYMFARGAEEAVYLAEHDVSVEAIPGVTSANAVPAYAGIPLTHRDYASSFAVITGHRKKDGGSIQVPEADTLVYLMGVAKLKKIVDLVIAKRASDDVPCAVIENGTTTNERVIVGTLKDIVKKTRTSKVKPPAVFIVGEVVNLRKHFGKKRILATGTDIERFKGLGEIIHSPAIKIEPINRFYSLDECIRRINRYDWIIFTSRFGVKYFLERLRNKSKNIEILRNKMIVAIGRTTSRCLKDSGLEADLCPRDESARGIVNLLKEFNLKGKKILIPRSNLAGNFLVDKLRRLGAKVDPVAVYKNVKEDNTEVDLGKIDEVIFTSPSTVKNFFESYKNVPVRIRFKALGLVTKAKLEEYGKEAEVIENAS